MTKQPGKMALSLLLLGVAVTVQPQMAMAQESQATQALKAQTVELRKDMVRVGDDVYTAVGYSPANISMIVGDRGIIIVDTGMAPAHAADALADFRKISSLPVAAIIYTHGHGDHSGGTAVFAEGANPQIWARSNFGSEGNAFASAGLTIQSKRGARQAGFNLPAEQRINVGIALPFKPAQGGSVFAENETVAPTHTFSEARKSIEVAGVKIDLVAAPGETADGLYVWLPESKTLFSGDTFYGSWPNLYAIRGTQYRDIRAWAETDDRMAQEGAEYLVPGHTTPIIGKAAVSQALIDYRDAIGFVFDKTVEGMNKGLTPDELVDYVKLPEELASKPYLQEFYGNVEWGVRSIFNGYLGWFDGNPTNLFSLAPKEEAERIATLAGGREALFGKARNALTKGDYQWAAELGDHLIALDPSSPEPKLLKADALTGIAENLLTATGRNYLLTMAMELRSAAKADQDP